MIRWALFCAMALTPAVTQAQGLPALPMPGTGALNPAQGAPPPPVKKVPSGECVTTAARNYESVRNYVPFVSLEDCLKSGGRPAKPGPAMGARRPS